MTKWHRIHGVTSVENINQFAKSDQDHDFIRPSLTKQTFAALSHHELDFQKMSLLAEPKSTIHNTHLLKCLIPCVIEFDHNFCEWPCRYSTCTTEQEVSWKSHSVQHGSTRYHSNIFRGASKSYPKSQVPNSGRQIRRGGKFVLWEIRTGRIIFFFRDVDSHD